MEFMIGGIIFLGFFYIALLVSEKFGKDDDEGYWRNKGGK